MTIRATTPCDGVGVLGSDRCLDARPERPARRAAALLGSRHRDRPDPATPLPSPAAPGRRVPARPVRDDAPRPLRPRLYGRSPGAVSICGTVCGRSRPARASISCSTARVCPSSGQVSGWPRNTVGCGRRGWRKLHLGVDQSGVIRVHTLTEATGDDATTGLDLLTAVDGPLVRVSATLPTTRSPSTKRQGRGVRRSSSHRPGRRPSLATARGRPRRIKRSCW